MNHFAPPPPSTKTTTTPSPTENPNGKQDEKSSPKFTAGQEIGIAAGGVLGFCGIALVAFYLFKKNQNSENRHIENHASYQNVDSAYEVYKRDRESLLMAATSSSPLTREQQQNYYGGTSSSV
jgi:hypothetical protein